MKYQDLLRKSQPIAYQTLYNGFKANKKSHIYLISGETSSQVKDLALFLAKSFVCDNDVLCCEECNTCKRIDSQTYVDLKFINEQEKDIKKDAIIELQKEFAMAGSEQKGIKIYIIHLFDKASVLVMNKLLKFIEEPNDDVIGILTTLNPSKILPTILSRCQHIKLISEDKELLKEELNDLDIEYDDKIILSKLSSSKKEAVDYFENKDYFVIKDHAIKVTKLIATKSEEAIYYVQKNIYPIIDKDIKLVRLFFNMVIIYLKDILIDSNNKIFKGKLEVDKEYIEKCLTKIIIDTDRLGTNINAQLLIDNLLSKIILMEGD